MGHQYSRTTRDQSQFLILTEPIVTLTYCRICLDWKWTDEFSGRLAANVGKTGGIAKPSGNCGSKIACWHEDLVFEIFLCTEGNLIFLIAGMGYFLLMFYSNKTSSLIQIYEKRQNIVVYIRFQLA